MSMIVNGKKTYNWKVLFINRMVIIEIKANKSLLDLWLKKQRGKKMLDMFKNELMGIESELW